MEYVVILPKLVNKKPGEDVKVDFGESPEEAAIRELKEESGLFPANVSNKVVYMGRIFGNNSIIHCIKIPIFSGELNPRPEEVEEVAWYHWSVVKEDPRLLPNLKLVLPLMMLGVQNSCLKIYRNLRKPVGKYL